MSAAVDKAKDAIDAALSLSGRRTERRVKNRIAMARDIIEYIELHYIENFNLDMYEINEEKRSTRSRR